MSPRSASSRWSLGRVAASIAGVVVVLAALNYVSQRGTFGRTVTDLKRPVGPLRYRAAPLQVVVHDIVESAPEGPVRVCRSLSDRPVTLQTEAAQPLGEILAELARQAGSRLDLASGAPRGLVLPTIRCPKDGQAYLVIGRPHAGGVP